jgi:Zn-dependent protease
MFTTFSLIVLFFSIVIHEIAHGSVALHLGDPTAKYAGRLTLNPIKHIDLFGTIILPLLLILFGSPFVIGWAKPVPVNPFNFRDQKWGSLKVSVAGPATNFLIAVLFGLIIRFVYLPDSVLMIFSIIVLYNFAWGIFNLLPIPPFDGSHILFTFLSDRLNDFKLFLHKYGLFILIFFIFFGGLNLIFQGAAILFYLVAGQPFVLLTL